MRFPLHRLAETIPNTPQPNADCRLRHDELRKGIKDEVVASLFSELSMPTLEQFLPMRIYIEEFTPARAAEGSRGYDQQTPDYIQLAQPSEASSLTAM